MHVRVDQSRCEGHNRCVAFAPELFDVDELGTARVRGDGAVPPELEDAARLAADNCPEWAVQISDA